MTTTQKPGWAREEDEAWAAVVELRLTLDQQAPAGLIRQVLAEAHDAVTETGRTPQDLFGDPVAYARAVAAERIGEEDRARVDARGLTPGERLTASLATLGAAGVVVAVLRWIDDGLWADVGWSSIAAFTAVVLTAVLVSLAFTARAAGRIAGSWAFAAAALVAVGGGGAVAGFLPGEPLFTFPVPALAVAGAALTAAAVAFPDATVDRWFTPVLRGGDERWLSRVEGLLRGRHALSAAEARAHVQEARQHLAASGDSAEEAFGSAEVYALRLADGPRRERRLARRKLYGATALAVLVVALVADELRDADLSSPRLWIYAVAAVYWIGRTARLWIRQSASGGRSPAR